MDIVPYIPAEKISEIMGRGDIHHQWHGEVYDWRASISFRTENKGMFCEGYLKLIRYLYPNISWLEAQFLNKFITIDEEKENDYYATRFYKIWQVRVNDLIDYMIDELKLTLVVEITR